jgi:superoxide reductase
MIEMTAATVDAAVEKHLPVVKVEGDTLTATVGSVEHPMSEEHWIDWIYVLTEKGGQMKKLVPGEKPQLTFALGGEKPLAVYAYCNLHGLWRTEL